MGGVFIYPTEKGGGAPPQASHRAGFFYVTTKEVFRWLTIKRIAGAVSPFAFWYEDDPEGGCIRFPTELESERMMGLPEGWTKYGIGGEEIRSAQRYKALGNAIALPCAEYIMAGICEVLGGVA